jgi:hypothetical protein
VQGCLLHWNVVGNGKLNKCSPFSPKYFSLKILVLCFFLTFVFSDTPYDISTGVCSKLGRSFCRKVCFCHFFSFLGCVLLTVTTWSLELCHQRKSLSLLIAQLAWMYSFFSPPAMILPFVYLNWFFSTLTRHD